MVTVSTPMDSTSLPGLKEQSRFPPRNTSPLSPSHSRLLDLPSSSNTSRLRAHSTLPQESFAPSSMVLLVTPKALFQPLLSQHPLPLTLISLTRPKRRNGYSSAAFAARKPSLC